MSQTLVYTVCLSISPSSAYDRYNFYLEHAPENVDSIVSKLLQTHYHGLGTILIFVKCKYIEYETFHFFN